MATKQESRPGTLPDHFSWSSLSLYADCPGAWCDKYLREIPMDVTDPLIFGSAFHALSAAYDEHCQAKKTGSDYTAIDRIFAQYMVEHPEALPQTAEIKALFTDYVHGHIVDWQHLIAVEWPLKIAVGKYTIVGILDRIYQDEDEITVRDLKTDGAIRSQADVDKDEQLGIYALLAAEHYEWPNPIRVEMEFVRYGAIRHSARDGDAIEATRQKIAAQIDQIVKAFEAWSGGDEAAFPYTEGARCSYCGYASRCPRLLTLSKDTSKIGVVASRDRAIDLASTRIALTERLKQINKALQPWCSEHGNVEVNGLELGYHKSESYNYPVAACAEILTAHKEDPLCYMRVDSAAIKKAMKSSDELRAAIERVREDASYTTFTARKIKG